jgi:hypothetical protein
MDRLRTALVLALLASFAPGCDQPAGEQVPTALVLTIAPMRAAYRTGENVNLVVTILDQNNEPIEDEGAPVEVSPATAASESGGAGTTVSFTLSETGMVGFSACMPGASSGLRCDSLRILVDDGSPVLEVSEPLPGAELGGDGAEDIVVRGSVSDMRMSRIFVNGMVAEVDGVGAFTAHVPARFGVNHLHVEASDGVVTPVSVQMDVLWGDDYIPARTSWGAPGVSLPEGAVLDLGAGFFDDGTPLASRERPVMTEDLADLATLVIGEIDAASLLPPNPVVSSSGLTLNIDDARLEGLSVEIQPDDGALDLFLRISDLQVDTSGSLTVESTTRSLNGGIGVSIAGYVRVQVGRARLEDPIVVELEELEVALERAEGRFEDPQVNAVFSLASGLLRTTLEAQLHTALDDLLGDAVPELLRGIFVGLDTALNGQEVVLDTGVFPTITLLIDGQLATLTSRYGRGIEGVLRIDAGIEGDAMHPGSRGIALSAEEGGDPFFRSARLQLGVRLALLNGLLHALWDGGMLEIDATALLPDSITGLVSEAVLHGRMAPIIRAAGPGEEHDLVLSVGQLELEAVFSGDPVRYGMTLEAGIDLALVDNRLTLTIAETPFIRVWAMDVASERALSAESLEELLLAMLWPSLRSSLADGLSLELPIPAPDALTELAPSLAGLSLSLSMTERIGLRDETLVIEGGLMGILP